MTTRAVAILHWIVAGVILLWVVAFYVLTQLAITLTLGVVISSIFIALGLVLSLGVNGAVFFRDRPLRVAEAILLGLEALVILLLVVAGVADQLEYASMLYPGFGGSFGHWLDWFMPLWLLIGPIAITVLVLAAIGRAKLPPKTATSATAR